MPAALKRALAPEEVTCPAGRLCGDAGVYCAIEVNLIDGRLEPETVEGFCTGLYEDCSSWRADKEETAAVGVVEARRRQAARERTRKADRRGELEERLGVRLDPIGDPHERRERALRLLTEDTLEGRRFRRRLGLE